MGFPGPALEILCLHPPRAEYLCDPAQNWKFIIIPGAALLILRVYGCKQECVSLSGVTHRKGTLGCCLSKTGICMFHLHELLFLMLLGEGGFPFTFGTQREAAITASGFCFCFSPSHRVDQKKPGGGNQGSGKFTGRAANVGRCSTGSGLHPHTEGLMVTRSQ